MLHLQYTALKILRNTNKFKNKNMKDFVSIQALYKSMNVTKTNQN